MTLYVAIFAGLFATLVILYLIGEYYEPQTDRPGIWQPGFHLERVTMDTSKPTIADYETEVFDGLRAFEFYNNLDGELVHDEIKSCFSAGLSACVCVATIRDDSVNYTTKP